MPKDVVPASQYDRLVWLLIVVGVALRTWQFAGNASLFIDEVALARNIAERGYGALLSPLDYGQVAPPGFLLVQRMLWNWFHTDWSLRLVPFLASLVALPLMRALARRTVQGLAIPLAVGALAAGEPFILYAAQVKQYSSDVAIAIGLLLLVVNILDDTGERLARYALTGLAGFVSVWFSNTAVLVIGGASLALCALTYAGHFTGRRRIIAFLLIPWALAGLSAGLVARNSLSSETFAYMLAFWKSGFPALPPITRAEWLWPFNAVARVFGDSSTLSYRFGTAWTLAALAGFALLWRRRHSVALVLMAPVLVTFLAAVAHQYPFQGRLILFLNPVLLIASSATLGTVAHWLGRAWSPSAPAIAVATLLLMFEPVVREHPVYRLQETRPLLAWLAAQRQPGDTVFVWYRAVPNVTWYGSQYALNDPGVLFGGCWLGTPRQLLTETNVLRGQKRVWIVTAGGGPELQVLSSYLGTIGIRRSEFEATPTMRGRFPMHVWQYDFSDPQRLKSALAETFPMDIPAPSEVAIKACSTGPIAPARMGSEVIH